MNDKIGRIAEQAGVDAGQTIANTICGDGEMVALGNEFNKLSQKTRDLIYKTLEQNQEKFAELIVRDCADFVAAGEFGDSGTAKQLIEHFGVDESKCQAAIDAARKEKT